MSLKLDSLPGVSKIVVSVITFSISGFHLGISLWGGSSPIVWP